MIPNIPEQNVLVTGGTKGIGLAIAEYFAEKGYNVSVTGRTLSRAFKGNINFIKVDFSHPPELNNFLENLSDKEFSIVINNAGINKIESFDKIPNEDFDNIINLNLKVPFLICQKVIPGMKIRKYGRIINIASIFSHITKEFRGSYSSSKFGLVGMTTSMAVEYAKENILCNCVSPGFIDTELTRTVLSHDEILKLTSQVPMKRLGLPEEIAKVVLFLASSENSFLTGQNIIVDGGFTSV